LEEKGEGENPKIIFSSRCEQKEETAKKKIEDNTLSRKKGNLKKERRTKSPVNSTSRRFPSREKEKEVRKKKKRKGRQTPLSKRIDVINWSVIKEEEKKRQG